MITIKDIKKEYKASIKKAFQTEIEKYINEEEVQAYIEKAMKCELTKKDTDELFKLGNRKKGKYPYLYWLCCIYMTPLTTVAYYANKIDRKMIKEEGVGLIRLMGF